MICLILLQQYSHSLPSDVYSYISFLKTNILLIHYLLVVVVVYRCCCLSSPSCWLIRFLFSFSFFFTIIIIFVIAVQNLTGRIFISLCISCSYFQLFHMMPRCRTFDLRWYRPFRYVDPQLVNHQPPSHFSAQFTNVCLSLSRSIVLNKAKLCK